MRLHLPLVAVSLVTAFAASSAHASPARVQGLSGNRAFTDDTDVFLFPSTISEVGNAVSLNYSGGVDGNVVWGDGQLLSLQRDSMPPVATGPGAGRPFSLVYGQGDGSTGWLARTSWESGIITAGGIWSKGGQGRETTNLAVGGDISLADTGGDSPDPAVSLFASGRTLESDSHSAWNAGVEVIPDVSNTVTGDYRLGPRWADGQLRAALSIGPGLTLVNTTGGNAVALDMPAANIAAEYELKEWLVVRGSAVAGWQLQVLDVSNFSDTRSFAATSSGTLGAGFKHGDTARFDMSITPAWAVQGPAVLSGVGAPMFLTVSGRFAI